jgi:hypothetical protein
MWISTMQDSRWLQQHGAALACARFEDLQVAPQPVILVLLAHCDLPMPDPDRLARVLAEDSQAGTVGAQDREAPVRRLTDARATWEGDELGALTPVTPPVRFGFASAPARPTLTTLTSYVRDA